VKTLRSLSADAWLVIIASALWCAFTVYVSRVDLMRSHFDEYTHIVSARLITDSLTPGMSQVGFWAPLLHVFLMPLYAVPSAYVFDATPAFGLWPLLCVATVVFRRLVLSLTGNRSVAFVSAVAFCANPYVLFFSATPMAEMPFLLSIVCALYFFQRWMVGDRLTHLIFTGVAVSMACLSRFEGFMLVPASTLAVVVALLLKRYDWPRFQASVLLFVLPAVSGICFIVSYSLAYSGEFLAYGSYSLNGAGNAHAALVSGVGGLPWLHTTETLWYAAEFMLPGALLIAACVAAPLVLAFSRGRMRFLLLMGMAVAPVVFVYGTILFGKLGLVVPQLPAGDISYTNIRYLLTALLPVLLSLAVVWSELLHLCGSVKFVRAGVSACAIGFLAVATVAHVRTQAFESVPFPAMYYEIAPYSLRHTYPVALREKYDFGKVLTLRYANDYYLVESGLPLSTFILESNYRYFDQAVREPWLFARWVAIPKLSKAAFPKFAALESDETFHRFYSPVLLADPNLNANAASLYVLNDAFLRQTVQSLGYDPLKIPSLNPDITTWNPQTIYEDIRVR
jgi:hypothetical protein